MTFICGILDAHQGRAFEILEQENADLRRQLARLHEKMPCGHEARFVVGSDEGTNWCALCLLRKMQENPNSVWIIDREGATDETD